MQQINGSSGKQQVSLDKTKESKPSGVSLSDEQKQVKDAVPGEFSTEGDHGLPGKGSWVPWILVMLVVGGAVVGVCRYVQGTAPCVEKSKSRCDIINDDDTSFEE